MKVKILASSHSGVTIGSEGEVTETMADGYCVRVSLATQNLFGGGTFATNANVFFSREQVEPILPREPIDPTA